MPLLPGKDNVGKNIVELVKSGHSRDQAIAIALKTSRQPRFVRSSRKKVPLKSKIKV